MNESPIDPQNAQMKFNLHLYYVDNVERQTNIIESRRKNADTVGSMKKHKLLGTARTHRKVPVRTIVFIRASTRFASM
jgi:hypothetical protein